MTTVTGPTAGSATVTEAHRIAGLHVETLSAGPPLLVAHGGPGMSHGLYRTLDPLAERRQLVFWDHRGHGRSDPLPDGPVEMALFADDAVRVADGLGLETFALFGHSFGGWVAQEVALRHPSRVSALVLAGTTPGQLGMTESPVDDQGPPPPPELAALLGSRPSTDAEAAQVYGDLGPFFLRGRDRSAYLAAIDREVVSATSFARVFEALGRWSAVDRLAQVRCPTLLLAGREDVFCSVQQHQRIARRVPDAKLIVLEQSGHFMWLDEPGRCLALLDGWLARRAA